MGALWHDAPMATAREGPRDGAFHREPITFRRGILPLLAGYWSFGQFWGVAAPPGTDPAIARWWEDKFRKAVATKAWQDGLKEKFQRSDFYGLEKAGEYFKREEAKFRSLMQDVGLAKK